MRQGIHPLEYWQDIVSQLNSEGEISYLIEGRKIYAVKNGYGVSYARDEMDSMDVEQIRGRYEQFFNKKEQQ